MEMCVQMLVTLKPTFHVRLVKLYERNLPDIETLRNKVTFIQFY